MGYIYFVHPQYEYSGFTLNFDLIKLLESYIILMLMFSLLPHGQDRISAIGLQLLFLLMVVPMLSLYSLMDAPRPYVYAFASAFVLTSLTVRFCPSVKIIASKNGNVLLFFVLAAIVVAVCVVLLKLNGIPTFKALNFSTVYEIREQVRYGPRIMGYLVSWVAAVINCFWLSFALWKRRHFSLIFILCLQLLIFLITANKAYLFYPIVVVAVIYGVKKQHFFRLTAASLILVILASLAINELNISSWPGSLFIRRSLFLPAKVSLDYYDFFSRNQRMHLSESRMGLGLADNPYANYNMPSANMMGMFYTGTSKCHMNTGYMGNAYMNFGIPGMMVFSLILGLLLVAADAISKGSNIYLVIGAMIIPIMKFLGGGLLTVTLTHGMLLGLVVIWLYRERHTRMFCFARHLISKHGGSSHVAK